MALFAASLAQAAPDDVMLDEITIRVYDDVDLSGKVFDIALPKPDTGEMPGNANGLAGRDKLPNENANPNAFEGPGNAGDRGRNAASSANERATQASDNANERATQASDNANERASQAGDNANEAAGNAAGNAAEAAADARENSSNASENARDNPSRNAPGRNRDKGS